MLKLKVNEIKWTEYTKKLIKEIPIRKCAEIGDKYNNIIRTVEENQAWQNMQYRNQLPS